MMMSDAETVKSRRTCTCCTRETPTFIAGNCCNCLFLSVCDGRVWCVNLYTYSCYAVVFVFYCLCRINGLYALMFMWPPFVLWCHWLIIMQHVNIAVLSVRLSYSSVTYGDAKQLVVEQIPKSLATVMITLMVWSDLCNADEWFRCMSIDNVILIHC